MSLILRWIINAVALIAITRILPGFEVQSFYAALIVALVLGLLNATIRPILKLITLPINVLTLGLFGFVINALIIWFVSTFVKGFNVDGFLPALAAAIILWAIAVLTNWFIKTAKKT